MRPAPFATRCVIGGSGEGAPRVTIGRPAKVLRKLGVDVLDCASPSGVPLRMSCQAAGPLGMTAAATVASRIAGTTPAVVDQASFGACISLGRRSGIVQFAHKDDRAVNLSTTGRHIAPVKEAVCRSTVWSLRREARKPGSAFWFKGSARPVEPSRGGPVPTDR